MPPLGPLGLEKRLELTFFVQYITSVWVDRNSASAPGGWTAVRTGILRATIRVRRKVPHQSGHCVVVDGTDETEKAH